MRDTMILKDSASNLTTFNCKHYVSKKIQPYTNLYTHQPKAKLRTGKLQSTQ